MFKKHLSFPKGLQQGRSPFDTRSVLSVREPGKTATWSVRATSAKPENAAGLSAVALEKVGGFFPTFCQVGAPEGRVLAC